MREEMQCTLNDKARIRCDGWKCDGCKEHWVILVAKYGTNSSMYGHRGVTLRHTCPIKQVSITGANPDQIRDKGIVGGVCAGPHTPHRVASESTRLG